MAAKILFREISLAFREISRNTKSKFGRNIRDFAKREMPNFGDFLVFSKKEKNL